MTNITNDITDLIEANYDKLFPSEKKVAEYILNNTREIIDLNVSELAKKANTSDATVVRAIKHLGFDGYNQMRLLISKALGKIETKIEAEDPLTNIQKFFALESERITKLSQTIDFENLVTIANIIIESERVHIIAVGNTTPISSDLGFRLQRTGVPCDYSLLFEQFINHINLGTQNDCVIAISRSGGSTQVIRAVELAKKTGMKIIAITGDLTSALASYADYIIKINEHKYQLSQIYNPDSHLIEIAINDAIIYAVQSIQKVKDYNPDDLKKKKDNIGILLSEFKQ